MLAEEKSPALSVILPTDTFATIQPVLECLRRQTIARKIEIVLVAPTEEAVADAQKHQDDFAAVRLVPTIRMLPLEAARGAGVRAAAAPFVFIGETHSFLHSDAAEKLINTANAGNWAAVAPGFENGNPKSISSWACFLADYGRWSAHLPAGEIPDAPLYNALYRREVLLGLGDDLPEIFSHGDGLLLALQAGGHRAYFEPAARIDHINLDRLTTSAHEQFLAGIMIGERRAARWPWWRRIVYLAGAGLIPFVLFRRIWPGIRQHARAHPLPSLTVPVLLLLMGAKATGEFIAYAGLTTARHHETIDHYEIHKIEYLA